ncbi:LysM peptidoglycan-binding domain-containing protein [Streptomyces aculeolatus]
MPSPHRPAHAAALLLRAAAALTALAALLAGVPYLLHRLGQLPDGVPTADDVTTFLSSPDDGTWLVTLVTLIGWATWAAFAAAVVLEAVAVIARRTAPKIRGLKQLQGVAGFLVGSIVLLAPAAAAASAPGTAVAAPLHAAAPAAGENATPSSTPSGAAATHRVTPETDTFWDVAQQRLGDGTRWQEVAALNPDLRDQPALPLGELLRLPAYALPEREEPPPAESQTSEAPSSAPSEEAADDGGSSPRESGPSADHGPADEPVSSVTVVPGDTLWEIAEDRLGDGTQHRVIFEENRGEAQPGGGHFTDPNVIIPGQKLDVPSPDGKQGPQVADRDKQDTKTPAPREKEPSDRDTGPESAKPAPGADREDPAQPGDHSPAESPTTAVPERSGDERNEGLERGPDATPPPTDVTEPAERPEPGGRERAGGGQREAEQRDDQPGPEAVPQPQQENVSPPSSRPSAPGESPGPAEPSRADELPAADPAGSAKGALIAVTGAGLLAAGLVTFLARQRIAQHQRRRRGRRIAMPSGRAAETEQQLRDVATPHGVEFVDAAVRTAAWHLAEADRELPELAATVLAVDGVTLYLTEDVAPVPPFRTAEGSMRRWWCPADTAELLDGHDREEVDAPYPTLVTLGRDATGALVLVDLEHFGAVYISGAQRAALLRTLAVELDTSVLADHLDLAVVGDAAPGLTMLVPERLTSLPALPPAARVAAERHLAQRHALAALAAQSVRHARLHPDVDAAFTPLVTIADLDETGEESAVRELTALTAARPRTATVLLACGSGQPPAKALHIDTDIGVPFSVPGCPVDVAELVVLSADDYADLMEIALTSHSPTDVPAVDPAVPNASGPAVSNVGDPVDDGDDGAEPEGHVAGIQVAPAGADDEDAEGEEGPPQGAEVSLMAQFADYGDDAGEPEPEPVDLGKPASVPSLDHDPDDDADASGTDDTDGAAVALPAARPAGRTRVDARIPAPSGEPLDGEAPQGAGEAGPLIRVLGPMDIVGARGAIASNRRTTALELAVWLALNPGHDHVTMDKALRPDELVSRKSRNSRITHVRTWLGTDPEGNRYFPQLTETPDRRYRLADSVSCDWQLFQSLAARGEHTPGVPGQALLRQSLELVRGRPFADAPPFHYGWAEPLEQDMAAAIVDTAETLAERCLADADPRGALWAAARGLSAAPEMERLHRLRFQAFAAVGDLESLERAALELRALTERSTGGSLDEETVTLLRSLLQTADHR